jgi:hypothetical protein
MAATLAYCLRRNADSLLAIQRVSASPSAARSTIPACSWASQGHWSADVTTPRFTRRMRNVTTTGLL